MDNKIYIQKICCFLIFLLPLNFIVSSCETSSNDLSNNKKEWYFEYMDYNNLHDYSTGEGQTIALIDSGISEFQDELVYKKTSVIDENYYDTNGHGTIMTSILKGDNKNLIGIAPDSKLISIKVLNSDGKIKPESIKKALRIAIDYKVDIINMSIGSYKIDNEIVNLINEAINENIIVVSSSGDYADIKLMFPANVDGVISVGAIDKNKDIFKNSTAPELTVINSPGENILGRDSNNNFVYSSGTSQSTALISGYLALLLDVYKKNNKVFSNNDLIKHLKSIKDNNSSYLDIIKLMED